MRSFATRCRSRVAYLPQGLGKNLYPTLSIFENVDFFGRLFGPIARGARVADHGSARQHRSDTVPRSPGGQALRRDEAEAGLCCSLIHDPDLLILDEPTTGVDPLARRQFWELIDRIRARRPSMSVLVATAYMDEAERFDWLVAMNAGTGPRNRNPRRSSSGKTRREARSNEPSSASPGGIAAGPQGAA